LVSDDGRGVPPEYRERVFGVFERLEGATDSAGIGLAACRKIVEHVGGSIRLVDVAAGTQVEIVLPPQIVRRPAPVAVGT
jgi:signal transduction histidine kinase